jgi:hypothetical protein
MRHGIEGGVGSVSGSLAASAAAATVTAEA